MGLTYEERQAYDAAYHAANRERIRARKRVHYATHREEMLAKQKIANAARPEERNQYDREYLATHHEKVRETKRAYCRTHSVERQAYDAIRRAAKAGATVAQRDEIREIYRRAREEPRIRCYLCRKSIERGHRHVDHIVPLSKGGDHRPANLAIACDECNVRKSAKEPGEVGVLI